jgi:hypothetical protein
MEMQNDKEQYLDNKVQELLKDLTVPYNPDHWTFMAERLEVLDATDADFDNLVRKQLENTTPSFQATHWDLMSKKLDDLTDTDADFDATIREQLNNIHRTYQPKHWDLMAQRIEQEFSWKAKIMRYKVIEVALMALLLFTVFNYFETIGYDKDVNFKTSKPNTIKKKAEPKQFNRGTDWRNRDAKNETKQQDNFNTQPETQQPPIVSIDIENSDKGESAFNSNSKENKEQGLVNQAIVSSGNSVSKTGNENSQTNKATLSQIPILKASEIALAEKAFNTTFLSEKTGISTGNTEGVALAQSIAVMRPNALTIAQMYDAPVLPQMAKKDKWWRLGIFGTNSASNVSSSYVYKETKKWNYWALNKGVGLVAGFKKKKIEVETGLTYSTMRYEPGLPESVVSGRVFSGELFSPELTKEVTLGLVKIPLNLNFDLKDKNRWHIYPTAGVAFNAAVNIDTVNFEPAILSQLAASNRNSKDKDFPKYGESFKIGEYTNNFYLTANIGVGVEYKITPTYSAYIQPQYERQFGKPAIGSRGDRINSLTVQGGLKMRFKNIK